MWLPVSPWRIQDGTGQTVSAGAAGQHSFTNPVGTSTQAIAIRLAPAATAYLATVRIGAGGNATASTDYPIASTDPPQVLGIAPGSSVSVYFGAAGSAQMCELSH